MHTLLHWKLSKMGEESMSVPLLVIVLQRNVNVLSCLWNDELIAAHCNQPTYQLVRLVLFVCMYSSVLCIFGAITVNESVCQLVGSPLSTSNSPTECMSRAWDTLETCPPVVVQWFQFEYFRMDNVEFFYYPLYDGGYGLDPYHGTIRFDFPES